MPYLGGPSHTRTVRQAIARIYRFGQTRPSYVYRLLYGATLEELIYDRNLDKEELFAKVGTLRGGGVGPPHRLLAHGFARHTRIGGLPVHIRHAAFRL